VQHIAKYHERRAWPHRSQAGIREGPNLLLTVNAAVAEGITSIATVHDSFGCLPSRAERFRQIIREQFVKLYEENDVLAQVLESAREDLGENAKGLPAKPPEAGSLEIFLSCIDWATRILWGDGPTMVPASSKIAQSLVVALSG
jgi:hypothetical protein